MGALGVLGFIIFGFFGLFAYVDKNYERVIVLAMLFMLSVFGVVYDLGTPYVTEVSYFDTVDYGEYDLNIGSDRSGRIRKTENISSRKWCTSKDSVKYEFIDFIDE